MQKTTKHADGTIETLVGTPTEIAELEKLRIGLSGQATVDTAKADQEMLRKLAQAFDWATYQKSADQFSPPDNCLVAAYFQANPMATSVSIFCPCRRCSPHYAGQLLGAYF